MNIIWCFYYDILRFIFRNITSLLFRKFCPFPLMISSLFCPFYLGENWKLFLGIISRILWISIWFLFCSISKVMLKSGNYKNKHLLYKKSYNNIPKMAFLGPLKSMRPFQSLISLSILKILSPYSVVRRSYPYISRQNR